MIIVIYHLNIIRRLIIKCSSSKCQCGLFTRYKQEWIFHTYKHHNTHLYYLQVVVQSNNVVPQITVERSYSPWSWASLITAMISILCCFALGFIATIMAVLSYVDHSGKQYERSKTKRRVAYGLAITAIIVGTITLIITIAVVFSTTRVMIQNSYK